MQEYQKTSLAKPFISSTVYFSYQTKHGIGFVSFIKFSVKGFFEKLTNFFIVKNGVFKNRSLKINL